MKFCLSCQKPFSGEDWRCPSCGFQPAKSGGFPSFAPEFEKSNPYFPGDSFDRLADLEEHYFWFRSRNELILWALRKWLEPKGKYLEVGCGNGFVLSAVGRAFPELELYGSEIHGQGLARAATRVSGATLIQMDARQIPFREEFNMVGLFDMLEHVPEDEKVLEQVREALKPGGGIILTVPQHPFLWSYVDEISRHVRRYHRQELVEKVRRAGFTLLGTTSFVSLLMPGLLLSRMGKKKTAPSFDPDKELKIHSGLDSVLGAALGFERFLIRCGVRFPFGGSILLAARKA